MPRELRFEVGGRLDAHGRELEPFDGAVPDGPGGVDAVAVCLLHADLDPAHERAVAAALRAAGPRRDVLARGVARVPRVRAHGHDGRQRAPAPGLPRLPRVGSARSADEVLVMTSAGGLVPVGRRGRRCPARLLLSGPAGGVRAAAAVAAACGFPDAVAFDMGGTSTDVCLVRGGVPEPAPHADRSPASRSGCPRSTCTPSAPAAGRSRALDPGGALVVGPESAGAVPGPACYGHGGTEPTVTDADLVLGRIPADAPRSPASAGSTSTRRGDALDARPASPPTGVVAVVDAAMERAVRVGDGRTRASTRATSRSSRSAARARCTRARSPTRSGMRAVIVPPRAGVFSAVGLLRRPARRELVRSWPDAGDHGRARTARSTRSPREVVALVGRRRRVVETAVDCRYVGQSHELTVADRRRLPGRARSAATATSRPDAPVEVVALRARATPPRRSRVDRPPGGRPRRVVTGPAVVAEPDCTVWVPDGWRRRARRRSAPGSLRRRIA